MGQGPLASCTEVCCGEEATGHDDNAAGNAPVKNADGNKLQNRPMVELDGGATYTGQWRGSEREGHGVLARPDGGVFTGQFIANKAQGEG